GRLLSRAKTTTNGWSKNSPSRKRGGSHKHRANNASISDIRKSTAPTAMSTITADLPAHSHAAHAHHGSFLTTYVFSRDHKIIGIQFLFSTLLWFFIGGLLALGVRWQLAFPWKEMPVIGKMLFSGEGGQ